ncbi:MAG: DUF3489 domain-containing protein [Rhizobiales bacterium]|nr:DUF3489 domain-containing protein [Hyphomicrobiales bacterium]OJU36267.1 MAG: hypothetical protein BGN94_12185 [Rhizobiales bacterium 68-8]
MTSSSNTYRRVRALVMKTTFNGCTVGEAVSAANLASKIIAGHGLDPVRIDWPAAPTGYEWDGVPGRGGKMMERPTTAEKPSKAKRQRKAEAAPKLAKESKTKKPAESKMKGPTRKEAITKMLRRPAGVTIADITEQFGVLPHTARAMVSVYGREIGGVAYDRATKTYRATAA